MDSRQERQLLERQRARIVWEALERAQDHVAPGHPAELHIRRALAAAEEHWWGLPAAGAAAGTDTVIEQRGKTQGER